MKGEVVELLFHDLNEGDVVRLKSGGPLMIVAIADARIERWVECIWAENRRLGTDKFLPVTLDVVARRMVWVDGRGWL